MEPTRQFRSLIVCLILACAFTASRAAAELLAYEPFDYAAGTPLVGANGGTGFASPWVGGGFNARLTDVFQVSSGTLEYPGLVMEGSTHVSVAAVASNPPRSGIGGLGRALPLPLGTERGTFYLSFLHRPDGDEEYGSIVLGTGQGNELAVGKSASTGEYYISNRGGVGRILSGVPGEVGKTRLVVVKMEFQEGLDRFTLFMDPVPGTGEPADGFVKEDLDLKLADRIFLYSRAAWSVDEIRLGTTWRDVTPAGGTTVAVDSVGAVSWKAFIWAGAILLALLMVAVALVIVWILAYRRGQKKARAGGN